MVRIGNVVFVALFAGGCATPAPSHPPLVDCSPSMELDAAGRLAELDHDGDGVLAAADIEEPGAVAVLTWWSDSDFVGTSVHTSASVRIAYRPPGDADWDPVWHVQIPLMCGPEASVAILFHAEDPNPTSLQVGVGGLFRASLDVPEYEVQGKRAGATDSVVKVTDVQAAIASGHLEGSERLVLNSLLPPKGVTGQVVQIEAFAFRDIPAETNQ